MQKENKDVQKTIHAYLSYIYMYFLSCSIEKDFANFLEFNNNLKAIKRFPCTF